MIAATKQTPDGPDASPLERLRWYLTAESYRPTVWGKNDCCMFAFEAARIQTGTDPGAIYRGRYCDEAGANELLSAFGAAVTLDRAFRGTGFPVRPRGTALEPGDCGALLPLTDWAEGEAPQVMGAVFDGLWWIRLPVGIIGLTDDQVRVLRVWQMPAAKKGRR